MCILLIIIIILMIKIISNQQEIDEHICDKEDNQYKNEMICDKGIINRIIFKLRVMIANIIYSINKESK